MLSFDQLSNYSGRDVCDNAGDKVGSIDDFMVDTDSRRPEWVIVKTGLFGMRQHFVPAAGISEGDNCLIVPYSKDMINKAPSFDPDKDLSDQDETELYNYYGLERSEAVSGTGYFGEEGTRTTGMETGRMHETAGTDRPAMTRSEEELRIGKVKRPRETVRLKKYIVTENVQTTVPVQHEEVRLEREPITEKNVGRAMEGPELSEREHEVTIMAEEPVVSKVTKPVERVRLEKDVKTEEEPISEEVRKERIDVQREDKK